MTEPDVPSIVGPRVRVMQLLVGGMAGGVASFALVAVVMRQAGLQGGPEPFAEVLGYIGIAVAVVACALSAIIPAVMMGNWRKQQGAAFLRQTAGRPEAPAVLAAGLITAYQSSLIVSCALLEGAAFLQLIVYFVGGESYSLGIALGLLVFLIAKMPTRDGVERWLAMQRGLMEEEQSRAPEGGG